MRDAIIREGEYVFRLAKECDVIRLIRFINENWGERHPIINNTEWFFYYYVRNGKIDFAICEKGGVMSAVCGFIPTSGKEGSDIWGSLFVSAKKTTGSGLALLAKLRELTGASCVAGANMKKNTRPIYRLLGWHADRMQHFYLLSDRTNYRVAVVHDKRISGDYHVSDCRVKIVSRSELSEAPFDNGPRYLRKDIEYFIHRYYDCPFYQYDVWEIAFEENGAKLYLPTRRICVDGTVVVHIVDFVGDLKLISQMGVAVRRILEYYQAEYIDCYCMGVPTEFFLSAGMEERLENDSNIIPLYLESPLVRKNIEKYAMCSQGEDYSIFQADGDWDRPYKA